jgi:hypothetical protein
VLAETVVWRARGVSAVQRGHEHNVKVEMTEDGALEHLDKLMREHTRHPSYYDHVLTVEKRCRETRILCWINTKKITRDAIHR